MPIAQSSKKFLSIDFGKASIKIVWFQFSDSKYNLLNYTIGRGLSLKNNRQQLVEFITNFLKNNSITDRNVYLTVYDAEGMVIRCFNMPSVPKEEIKNALQWQLKEEDSFDMEAAFCQWRIVNEYTASDGTKKNEIVLMASRKEIINEYIGLLKDCGLEAQIITGGPFNYENIIRFYNDPTPTQAVLDIGSSSATLCIFKNKVLSFVRILPFSCENIQTSAASESLTASPQPTTGQNDNLTLRYSLERLAREVSSSFIYFTSNLKSDKPASLYITGGVASLEGSPSYFKKELNIEVKPLTIPECINTLPVDGQQFEKDKNQLISALGAAISDAKTLNLVTKDKSKERIEMLAKNISPDILKDKYLRGVVVAIVGFFILLNLISAFHKMRLSSSQNKIQALEKNVLEQESIEIIENPLMKMRYKKVPAQGLLQVISATIPANIILNYLELNQANQKVVLKGHASDAEESATVALTTFMKKMEESSFFREASLVVSEQDGGMQKFEIVCDLAS